jgi:predicted TIM-barrel fold metal-dependent hydrolase
MPERAPAELDHALGRLGRCGIGEIYVRSLTNHVHPEKIADDHSGVMRVAEKYQVPIQFPTSRSQFPGGLFCGDPVWAEEVTGRHPTVPVILTRMGRSIDCYFDT